MTMADKRPGDYDYDDDSGVCDPPPRWFLVLLLLVFGVIESML